MPRARVDQRAAAGLAPPAAPGSRATARPSRALRAGRRARARRRRSPRVSSFTAPPPCAGAASLTTRSACSGAHTRRGALALVEDRGDSASLTPASARQRVPKPTCQRSSRSTSSMPCSQPGQPVVDEVEQRVLAGGEHHALQDHVVEPDRLDPGAPPPPPAAGPRTARGTRRDTCARGSSMPTASA